MANTLFDHGTEYNFYRTNFTENHATMRKTKPDSQKPTRLEMLQEDYRSRLLREREQKANALFETRVRAKILPKKGSVREFFLNRRMLAAEACNAVVDLPPITSNTRYEGKQRDKTRIVGKRGEKEKVEAIDYFKNNQKQKNHSEQDKLRKKNRKSRTGVAFAKNEESKLSTVEFSSTYEANGVDRDGGNAYSTKPRGVKSREVFKRQKRPSDEYDRTEYRNDEVFASLAAKNNKLRARKGVKSREVYKRGSKPANEEAITETNVNEKGNGECLARSFSEVSKSLVKIKELVHRRKTEELILRSNTARPAANESHKQSSPRARGNSQSFDEMCRVETELRETISREQKKLLELQKRMGRRSRKKREQESRNYNGEKQHRSTETRQGEANMVKISPNETQDGNFKRETRSKQHRNAEYQRTNEEDFRRGRGKSVSYEYKVSELTGRTQTSRDSTTKSSIHKETNANATSGSVIQDLVTCPNCGRGFMKERIAKHEKACRKASARIKKPFDAKRKRAEGTDMEKYLIMGKETSDDSKYKDKKKNDWRKTHENFIQSIRSARHQEPGPPTPLTNPDYIECSYCQRKFKPSVAERHIPRCKETRARPRPPRR
ncbi:zinc finger C2HC domain-containing protein 1C-like isoform X2 [Dendronephthya gigantea]|nr:zinc finger C2HC domain-containing protein 1C-like isoform X2 [Dendronephthya gigantea]XP_028396094.1 zinc finger C2HC domain-containing protein 1C-like isoform X2 [Dendronephthya gigantea]